jgi:glycosyltransferase involved in cell wall biosynthesis
MKILQVNKFHYYHGGADGYYLELSRILEEQGHEVSYFSMKNEKNIESPHSTYFVENVDFNAPNGIMNRIKCFTRVIYSFEARRNIKQVVDLYQPDIVHLHNIYHQISPSILPILKKNDLPVVMTAHDYKVVCPNYSLFNGYEICEKCRDGKIYHVLLSGCHNKSIAKGFTLAIEAYLYRFLRTYQDCLDIIITPSMFMKTKFEEYGISSEKIIFIPNFVDPIPVKLERREEGDYLLYFGRLSREKGLMVLILAMRKHPDLSLIVAGDGPERRHLERLCDKEGIFNVKFVGKKNSKEIKKLIEHCMFTVLPSICYENCPLSVLESMASGKPVIGSQIGGIPDLIENGKDGLLFKAGNDEELSEKIGALAKDKDLRDELGRNSYNKVKQNYSKETHLQSILSVYKNLLEQ